MKVRVFEKETEEEKEILLKLEQSDEGVMLIATDKMGEKIPGGNILRINSDGSLSLASCVRESIGLKLTGHDVIKLGRNF